MSSKPVICFDTSKNERFQISDNYKMMHRKLKVNWNVEQSVSQKLIWPISKHYYKNKTNIFQLSK